MIYSGDEVYGDDVTSGPAPAPELISSLDEDPACKHGTDPEKQCGRCDRNKDCNWNDGNECYCD